MIEEMPGLPAGTLGFEFTGRVSGGDYDSVLTPAIDRAIERFGRIRALVRIAPEFEGYDLDAMWDDTKLGLKHWSGFERIAMVTEVNWIRTGVKAMAFMLPCPVQIFDLDDLEAAKRWLTESLGSIHLDHEGNTLVVRLLGKLDPSAYDGVDDEIGNAMSKSSNVRLLLDLREFDGWSGLSALGDHLSLVREYHRVPERIAIVGDKAWQRMAEKIMSKFVNAEARFFDAAEYDAAAAWSGN
jgi:hypothetical protein